VQSLRNDRKKLIFAIFGAIVMIASSAVIIYHYESSHHDSPKGVPVNINVFLTGIHHSASPYSSDKNSGFIYNLSNASVTLLSPDPLWIATGGNFGKKNITYNLSDNKYITDVFNGRSNSKGIISGYVNSTSLLNIALDWRGIIHNKGYKTSVIEEATYSYIRNGTLYGFDYFNNIAYSPFSPIFNSIVSYEFYKGISPLYLSSSISFNLSNPVFEKKIYQNATNANISRENDFREIGGGGGGGNPCTPSVVDKTIKVETWTGMLPLLYSSMNLPSDSLFLFASGFTSGIQNINPILKFNSAQHTQNQNGVFQSTTASYEATLTYPALNAGDLNHVPYNETLEYLSNASFEVVEYKVYYISTQRLNDGTYYCVATPGPTVTTMEVVGTHNPRVRHAFPYLIANNGNASETADYWSTAINMLGMAPDQEYHLGIGKGYARYIKSYISTESNNANSYLEEVENGVGIFTAAIGVAFAINAVTGIIPLADSAEDVVDELSLALAEVGLRTTIVSAFTSISVIVNENISFSLLGLVDEESTNPGSALNVYLYYSSDTVHFYGSTGDEYSYNPYMSVVKAVPVQ
jgi:hypothetical protein